MKPLMSFEGPSKITGTRIKIARNSQVKDNARISGDNIEINDSIIYGNAIIEGSNVYISGRATVGGRHHINNSGNTLLYLGGNYV